MTVTLSSQSTGWTALMFAVNEGHKDMVRRLMSAGADVLIKDKVCCVMDCVKYGMKKHVHSVLVINRHKIESRHGKQTLTL